MENVSRIANSISIDNRGELNDFSKLVANRRITGGIARYTVTHYDSNGMDLRSSNLSKNYENGERFRVPYDEIDNGNLYSFLDRTELNGPVFDLSYGIGDLYHLQDEDANGKLKFITKEGFYEFERLIRDKSIMNYTSYGSNVEDYASNMLLGAKDTNNESVPKEINIGDPYTVEPYIFAKKKDSDLKVYSDDFKTQLMSKTNDVSTLINDNEIIDYGKLTVEPTDITLKDKKPYSMTNTDEISTTHLDRNYIKGYSDSNPLKVSREKTNYYRYVRKYNDNADYFQNIKPGQEIDRNLYEYNYGEYVTLPDIADIEKEFIGIKFQNDVLNVLEDAFFVKESEYREKNVGYRFFNGFNGYTYYKDESYAIEGGAEVDYYSTNEEQKPLNLIITHDNEGGLISFKDGKKAYVYYSESENGGTPSIKSDEHDAIKLMDENALPSDYSPLLRKTNDLFRTMKINSMVNRFHLSKIDGDDKKAIDGSDELVSSYNKNFGISRGRNLITKSAEKGSAEDNGGYEDPYCRVWTAHYQYSKLSRRIRPFYNGSNRYLTPYDTVSDINLRPIGADNMSAYSVLGNDGFVKIPYTKEDFESDKNKDSKDSIKNYMFSIENLAWKDIDMESAGISKEQIGPNGGRIMWFPPYNLKFSENINVDWNANKFIGRGEQIYTYTNTDRNGTLDFTLLIDHPSIINKFNSLGGTDDTGETERDLLRFFAGCGKLEFSDETETTTEGDDEKKPTKDPEPTGQKKDFAIVLFFPNNYSGVDYSGEDLISSNKECSLRKYECNSEGGSFTLVDKKYQDQVYIDSHNNDNKSLYSLNKTDNSEIELVKKTLGLTNNEEIHRLFNQTYGIDKLSGVLGQKITEDCEIGSIDLYGYASSDSASTDTNNVFNPQLCKDRSNTLKKIIQTIKLDSTIDDGLFNFNDGKVIAVGNRDINSITSKIARSAVAIFHIVYKDTTQAKMQIDETSSFIANNIVNDNAKQGSVYEKKYETNVVKIEKVVTDEVYKYDNEYKYFSSVRDDEIAYQSILNKVRYFLPAYHSITPEGFNARLSFLHQCTRQGPTSNITSDKNNTKTKYLENAGNLSFGRPPYCILRIGDFFNTKICIESISISYDVDGGVQWDLNPEGAGVQPMYANITMSFKFIGGQDISGPIERLQNAVTYNYYANASIYDKKADSKKKEKPYDARFNNETT